MGSFWIVLGRVLSLGILNFAADDETQKEKSKKKRRASDERLKESMAKGLLLISVLKVMKFWGFSTSIYNVRLLVYTIYYIMIL